MSYQDTSLWKRTLGQDNDAVRSLRESFMDARINAEFLLAKIRKDFPNLTVHDITHVDSLWEVADTIIGPDYTINPLEGYILGVSFLIHDAVLSYDAFGGVDKLRETVEWKDAFADYDKTQDIEEFKKDCDFTAIRALHARKAERILFEIFERDNHTTFYIINDDSIRNNYGELIGKIAASHHWEMDEISSELKKQVNPRHEYPSGWIINAQKLACILRCADAGHIDNGRAPDHIYNILNVNGVSKNHWESQNHLSQVCEDLEDKSMLCINSSTKFKKNEFAAWNVAYDAIKIFDSEIKASNALLKIQNLEFPHRGVSGANSKEELAKYIETEKWFPCNVDVHASNVKALIYNLGGRQIYGNENIRFIILRELIQNARDAIMARKYIDENYQDGRITIKINKDKNGSQYIAICDNGIGMTKNCIQNYLLNFGSSYWCSSLSKQENPGLRSNGFSAIGKYGIGFYSVFMQSKPVRVITRRYNVGMDEAIEIDFPKGFTLSPILSKSKLASDVSTCVCIYFNNVLSDVEIDHKELREFDIYRSLRMSFVDALRIVTAGLDVNVYFNNKEENICIHKDVTSSSFDKKLWLKELNLDKIKNIDKTAEQLELIKDEKGKIRGLIGIPDENCFDKLYPSIISIGGLACSLDSSFNNSFIGCLDLKEKNISRNEVVFDEDLKKSLRIWLKNKYKKDYETIVKTPKLAAIYRMLFTLFHAYSLKTELVLDNERKLYADYLCGKLKIDVGTLNGLNDIHKRLYSGFIRNAGGLNTTKIITKFGVNVNDTIISSDSKASDSFENIISKFIIMINSIEGEVMRSLRIWINLILHNMNSSMIDWNSINMDVFYTIMNKNKDKDQLTELLRNHIKPTKSFLCQKTKTKSALHQSSEPFEP